MNNKNVLALIGLDAPSEIADSLLSLGFSVLRLPPDARLAPPVRTHADMLMLPIGKRVFTTAGYLSVAKDIFATLEDYGYEVIACECELRSEYPYDVALDALVLRNAILCRTDVLPREVSLTAREMGYSLINSKQGYAKCSAVALNGGAIVTADKNIAALAASLGAHVLSIGAYPEAITLDGYDCGFIGGASGVFEDTVYFTGDLSRHPDGTRIADFCRLHGKRAYSLSQAPLCDVGGVFFFQGLT